MSDRPTPKTGSVWHGPFSYDLANGAHAYEVAMLRNPNHSQGSWVKLVDYLDMERQRDAYAETLRFMVEYSDTWRESITDRHPELAP